MNYRNKGNKIAEIGIKIRRFEQQEKGYGTRFLRMLISFLFDQKGYDKIILIRMWTTHGPSMFMPNSDSGRLERESIPGGTNLRAAVLH